MGPFRMLTHSQQPRVVLQRARLVAWMALLPCGPLFAVRLAGWVDATAWWRPVYFTLLLVGVGAANVAALAGCHLAIQHAFRAGYETGQASVWGQDDETRPSRRQNSLLRLVGEDDSDTT